MVSLSERRRSNRLARLRLQTKDETGSEAAQYPCLSCDAMTDIEDALVCHGCTAVSVECCFKCGGSFDDPARERCWLVETRHPGVDYWDMEYLAAVRLPGPDRNRYTGPVPAELARRQPADWPVYHGPVPMCTSAWYAHPKVHPLPWSQERRRRPLAEGPADATLWRPTGLHGEYGRRVPHCVACALSREYLLEWNIGHGHVPVVGVEQLARG
jgi:hypothetical protein